MTRDDRQDPRLARLNAELRERGRTPERDLWPEIDAAISAAERNQLRPRQVHRPDPLRWAAAAAVAALLLAGGWWTLRQPVGPWDAPVATRTGTEIPAPAVGGEGDGLAVIHDALAEVNLALAEDPENRSLANLAVMLHRSRGRVLRQSDAMHITGG